MKTLNPHTLRGTFRKSFSSWTTFWIRSCCLCCAVVTSTAATLDTGDLMDLSLEELMNIQVTTVSRISESLDDAPGTIYVFDKEQIHKRGYQTLAQLLRVVPGFTVVQRDLQLVVGVRGLNANDNDKISVLINGQRILGLHEQDFLNGPMLLDNAERVEVVVGPSSLFQQADTLAATVNIITRETEGLEVVAATGTDLPYAATVMGGKQWAEDRKVHGSFSFMKQKGYDAWMNNSRLFLPGEDSTGGVLSPSFYGVFTGTAGEWSAQAVAYRSETAELHIEGADAQNDGRFIEEFYSFMLKHEHGLTDSLTGILKLEGLWRGQERKSIGGPSKNAIDIETHQRSLRGEVGLRYTGIDRHTVQAGLQTAYEDNFDTGFRFQGAGQERVPRYTLVSADTGSVGVYLDDEFTMNEQWKFIGGVRADYNERVESHRGYPGWRSAIIHRPKDNWTSKLVFNRSVRMPSPLQSLNEVWGANNPLGHPGNLSFAQVTPTVQRPERLTTLEFQNIVYLKKARLGATVYHQDLQDFISWFQPWSNGGDFSGEGVEVSLDVPVNQSVKMWCNASWNDSELDLFSSEMFGPVSNIPEDFHAYVNNENRIIGSAEYTANAGLDCELFRGVSFSPTVRYFTEQAAINYRAIEEGGPEIITVRNRVYVDASLVWKLPRPIKGVKSSIRLSGYNLTDNQDRTGVQMSGDTYRPRGRTGVLSVHGTF